MQIANTPETGGNIISATIGGEPQTAALDIETLSAEPALSEAPARPTSYGAGAEATKETAGESPSFVSAPSLAVEPIPQFHAVKMSFFENAYATVANGEMTVAGLLEGIKTGQWQHHVEKALQAQKLSGPDAYKEAKKELPAVSISGIIDGKRKDSGAEGRLNSTGLIQCDCDAKDHPNRSVSDLKSSLIDTGFFIAVWISPSGTGVKGIARVSKDPADHLGCFLALEQQLKNRGLVLDPATKDATRLMFVSYDPEIWINPELPQALQPLQDEAETEDEQAGQGLDDDAVEEVREILAYIPARPGYDEWARITWAVFNVLGVERGLPLLKDWSPEEKLGEYKKLYDPKRKGKRVGLTTLRKIAASHGYDSNGRIPPDVVPVPCGEITYTAANLVIFKLMAETKRFFIRENKVVEVEGGSKDGAVIAAVTPKRFVLHVEKLGRRVARREEVRKGTGGQESATRRIWRTTTFPIQAADVALQSDEARDLLPPLRQILNAPVIVDAGDNTCKVLESGYHPECGGTYVASSIQLIKFSPGLHQVAVNMLKQLLEGFNFATESDRSRAMAGLISPALKAGKWIAGDFPLHLAEATESQSGKTYLQKLVCTLYNEVPSVITQRRGGVGSLDESISNALLAGKSFISIDNMRGAMDSQPLENALRGYGVVECRGFRANNRVDVTPVNWQLSTNGAELTPDLANRACIVRIKKQPSGYKFKTFAKKDLLGHVAALRGNYLAAVFELIREWVARGKPTTDESRHDFHEWTQALDWIVQHLFGLPPLLDGHREQQIRVGDSKLQWLREVVLASGVQVAPREFTTSELVEIVSLPGVSGTENPNTHAGKVLSQIFKQAGAEFVEVDGFRVNRFKVPVQGDHGQKDQWRYKVGKIVGAPCPPCPPCCPIIPEMATLNQYRS